MQPSEFHAQLTSKGGLRTRNRVVLSSIDSTNRLGKTMASFYLHSGEELSPTLLVALEQTGGRGRLGRRWLSPLGGIYVSLVWPMGRKELLSGLPLRVAAALCRELDGIVDLPCRLKWPNDLIVDGGKVGGILIEAVGRGENVAAVLGFGINYAAHSDELAPGATTLQQQCSVLPPVGEVGGRLIRGVENELIRHVAMSQVVLEYSRWSLHVGNQEISCQTSRGVAVGTFLGFDERGFLRLATATGEQQISAGDIIEHGLDGAS